MLFVPKIFFSFKSLCKTSADVVHGIICSYLNNQVLGSFFQYCHNINKKNISTYFQGKILPLLNHSFRVSFPSNQISLNHQLLCTFLLAKNSHQKQSLLKKSISPGAVQCLPLNHWLIYCSEYLEILSISHISAKVRSMRQFWCSCTKLIPNTYLNFTVWRICLYILL